MLMLMALREYKPALYRQGVNDYSLGGLQGRELRTMTVGIVGTGRIGRAVAEILRGFGCRMLAYDPYPADSLPQVRYVSLAVALPSERSDHAASAAYGREPAYDR